MKYFVKGWDNDTVKNDANIKDEYWLYDEIYKINEKNLDNIINKFLVVYNRNDITIERKNQLYLNLGEEQFFDFDNIYKMILQYINKNLI